jgi:hypothetical protein
MPSLPPLTPGDLACWFQSEESKGPEPEGVTVVPEGIQGSLWAHLAVSMELTASKAALDVASKPEGTALADAPPQPPTWRYSLVRLS